MGDNTPSTGLLDLISNCESPGYEMKQDVKTRVNQIFEVKDHKNWLVIVHKSGYLIRIS